MNIASYIKEGRLNKKMTQSELASALGLMVPQFIYNIENEKNNIPISMIKPICKILGLNKNKLINLMVDEYKLKLMEESK